MDKYTRYLKRLAKKAGVPTREVREVWEAERKRMVEEGLDKNPLWLQDVSDVVKKHFGIVESTIALDKFKKFL